MGMLQGFNGVTALGLVDGSVPSATDRFTVCLNDDVVVQLDDLVCVTDELPDGRPIAHYGIVVTQTGYFEGAQWATDTARIALEHTQPGERVRRVELHLGVEPSHYEPGDPDAGRAATTGAQSGRATGKTEEREALKL